MFFYCKIECFGMPIIENDLYECAYLSDKPRFS
jgi:hypothetical protein